MQKSQYAGNMVSDMAVVSAQIAAFCYVWMVCKDLLKQTENTKLL